jgi:hypothetical protein
VAAELLVELPAVGLEVLPSTGANFGSNGASFGCSIPPRKASLDDAAGFALTCFFAAAESDFFCLAAASFFALVELEFGSVVA